MAYADPIGSVSLSTDPGVTVQYSDSGLAFISSTPGPNAFIQNSIGNLNGFLPGESATLDGISFLSDGTIQLYGGIADIFQADGGALDFVATSATWSIYGADELAVTGTGYFTVNGVEEAGTINIAGTQDGLYNVSETGLVTSVTPEPTSLVLLGTGLLSAAGIARRKFAAKA